MLRWIGTRRRAGARIGNSVPAFKKGKLAMRNRFSRVASAMLVAAAIVLMANCCWATFFGLGPSKDEWGLKYEVAVSEADGDTLTVVFTLADEGRLKPIYSVDLIALSKQTDSQGGRSYDVKAPIEFKTTKDGRRAGQVQIRKEFADRAKFRILTQNVDGKRQTSGAAHYDIPLKKYLNQAPAEPSPIAAPPASKVKR
jgi:hypothetical protein